MAGQDVEHYRATIHKITKNNNWMATNVQRTLINDYYYNSFMVYLYYTYPIKGKACV